MSRAGIELLRYKGARGPVVHQILSTSPSMTLRGCSVFSLSSDLAHTESIFDVFVPKSLASYHYRYDGIATTLGFRLRWYCNGGSSKLV